LNLRSRFGLFVSALKIPFPGKGVSPISPFATIAGARAVNDPTATNVAQIVISGTMRHRPKGIISMPAFGSAYSDAEIAQRVESRGPSLTPSSRHR
jgi:hypothetical protein